MDYLCPGTIVDTGLYVRDIPIIGIITTVVVPGSIYEISIYGSKLKIMLEYSPNWKVLRNCPRNDTIEAAEGLIECSNVI